MADQLPTDIMPTFRFRDADAAIALAGRRPRLHRARRHAFGHGIGHGELRYGNAMMMVALVPRPDRRRRSPSSTSATPRPTSSTTTTPSSRRRGSARSPRARRSSTRSSTQPYGGTSFTVQGPEGHYWTVGSYRPSAADRGTTTWPAAAPSRDRRATAPSRCRVPLVVVRPGQPAAVRARVRRPRPTSRPASPSSASSRWSRWMCQPASTLSRWSPGAGESSTKVSVRSRPTSPRSSHRISPWMSVAYSSSASRCASRDRWPRSSTSARGRSARDSS